MRPDLERVTDLVRDLQPYIDYGKQWRAGYDTALLDVLAEIERMDRYDPTPKEA